MPGDLSSAAFMIAAAVLVPGSAGRRARRGRQLDAHRLSADPRAHGRGRARRARGCRRRLSPTSEPICDLEVSFGPLAGTVVEAAEVPLAIDELPLVALLGCFAEGETIVRGAQELRVKESDRIAGVVDGLRGLGATIEATPDGLVVTGTGGLRGGIIDPRGDHRMAMLGAVAGLASAEGVEVVGMEAAVGLVPGVRGGLGGVGIVRASRSAGGRRRLPRSRPRARALTASMTDGFDAAAVRRRGVWLVTSDIWTL